MGTGIRQSPFEPLIAQIERNLAIAIKLDYPGQEQLLTEIAGQLEDFGQAVLDLSHRAKMARKQ